MTHLPFRSWCRHCVRGRAESHPHLRQRPKELVIPELHADYCFLGKADEKTVPIMVLRDRATQMTCSMIVREKGIGDGHVVRRVIAFIRELGYDGKKLVLKSDQESSVNAVLVRVAQKREGETFLEHSPLRSSGSNGIIERGIKDVQRHIRSMKSAIDERINTDLSGSSNVLCWLVEFAAFLINSYSVGHDGKTPYERLKGKKSNMFGFEFGERVLFRRVPVPAKLAKLDSLWNIGVFVGYRSTTGEYMVVTSEGAWKTRTLRRQPKEERWRREDVESMKCTPWTTNDGATTMESSQEEEVHIDYDRDLGYDIPPVALEPA